MKKLPLLVKREISPESAEALVAWAKERGLKTLMKDFHFHLTVIYSKTPVEHTELEPDTKHLKVSVSHIGYLGENQDVLVAHLKHYPYLEERHQYYLDQGAETKFPKYKPHITLTWQGSDYYDMDFDDYEPDFQIELGPEIIEEADVDWSPEDAERRLQEQLRKL